MSTSDNTCIDHGFTTGTSRAGYKQVSHLGFQTYLHRVVLADKLGIPVTSVDTAMHSCDNPRCINPDHLSNGTRQLNNADMVAKGRHPHGERNGKHKLKDAEVSYILDNWVWRDPEYGTNAMARKFNVHASTISTLLHNSRRGR